jgi:hypothetical protein
MKLDLLNFTQNPVFIDIIHYKGISAAQVKTIFSVALLPLPFGFLINRCTNPEIFTHAYSKDYTILLLCVLAVYTYFFKCYAMPLINQYRSKTWKQATAEITEIGIFKVKFPVLYSFFYAKGYFPALIYTYEVNQQKYRNRKLSFASDYVYNQELDESSSNQYNKMNEQFAKWMKEKKLEIYYNPNNPKESVIFRDFPLSRKIFYRIFGTLSTMALLVSTYNLLCYVYWIT